MKIQFTNIPELREVFALDRWSRDHMVRLLGNRQIGYDIVQTTMAAPAFRFRTREDFDLAKRLIQEHEIKD
jgi:hypothetical protein